MEKKWKLQGYRGYIRVKWDSRVYIGVVTSSKFSTFSCIMHTEQRLATF